MHQELYQRRLGLGYNVTRGSRLLALRRRDSERRDHRRIRIAFGGRSLILR
jgi:hypothetical protein